jgi:hypothetical protein
MQGSRNVSFAAVFAVVSLFGVSNAAAAAPEKPGPSKTDDRPSKSEIEAMLVEQYREKIKHQVDYLYGRTRTEIKKIAGIKSPAPSSAASPSAQPSQSFPLGPCNDGVQPLLIRRDRLDTFQLRETGVPLANAKGASISVLRNEIAGTTTATVNGRVQAILYNVDALSPCDNGKPGDPYAVTGPTTTHFGFLAAPFVDAQGTISDPKKSSDVSNLQSGIDLQMSVLNGAIFAHQYFIATPYYQTDFRGSANVQGIRAAWEPVDPDFRLGTIGVLNPYMDWFWQLRAEADAKNVTTPGSTGLLKGRYNWLGGTVQVHFLFFPGRSGTEPTWISPAPGFLVDRFYANASLSSYWETDSGRQVTIYEGEVGYNITTDGKSSVSVKYDQGTDKDTLMAYRKYLVALNLKY